MKARMDKTQRNSKCRLWGDWDETINPIISESSKLAQKEYKTIHDFVVNVIHWEMCKKFKFDHTNKWYMNNPAAVLENDTHKLLWDFGIQTDHLISARNQIIIKGTEGFWGWRTSGDHPNYNITETGQNTGKSSGDLRWLAVTQTPV